MKIGLGSDHGGFDMKEDLKNRLVNAGYEVLDCGCYSKDPVDYPDVAVDVARRVVAGDCGCAILCCGTGIGISIAANRVRGIRAAHLADVYSAKMAKMHNNANIIALGGRTLGPELAWEIVQAYLGAEFLGGIHRVRLNKISAIDE